jgi:glycosyltransferase involved in cell wall biosynthesis
VKTSIIIPTYNYGRILSQSIESALAQTREANKVIMVDANSIDDSVEIEQRYPVRLLRRTQAGGISGIKRAATCIYRRSAKS